MKKIRTSINKNSRTFLTFLISYILILIIPIIVFNSINNQFIMKTLKDEATKNSLNSLITSKALIDKEIQQIYGISYKILYKNKNIFSYYNMEKSREVNTQISDELRYSIISNLAIEDVALYKKGNPIVYTSSGNYKIDTFFDTIYKYEKYTIQDFTNDINNIMKIHIVPELSIGSSSNYITAIYPAPSFTQKPNVFLMFFIKEKAIIDYINVSTDINKSNNIIINKEHKNIITSINTIGLTDQNAFIEELLSVNNEDYKITNIEGKDFYIFVSDSNVLPWRYVSLISAQSVLDKINESQRSLYIGLIFIVIMGSVIIFYFMLINYIPIKQMRKNIESLFANNPSEMRNEMDIVKDGIRYLSEENRHLNSRFKNNIPKVRDSLILSVLKGQFETLQEFNECGRDIGLSFKYRNFQVLAIMSDTSNILKEDIVKYIKYESEYKKFQFYCVDRIEKNQYIVILNSNEMDSKNFIESLESIKDKAKNEKDSLLTIGVGNTYSNVNRVTMSYVEATTALKYKFVKGYNQIISISELTSNCDVSKYYPKKEIDDLKLCIKQKKTKNIDICIDKIIEKIANSKMPIFMAQGICLDIINSIMQSEHLVVLKNIYPDIMFIESADTIEQLLNFIKDICNTIGGLKENKAIKETKEEKLIKESISIEKISNYINKNYSKCDFSIQEVSDYFDMKLSYMSQFYKAQTNQTMLDYVTNLRVEKAKMLLTTTELSLNYISEEVGYYNVSSFIRRFKQVTGLPPGEFRKSQLVIT